MNKKENNPNLDLIRESFARVMYSHTTHEYEAQSKSTITNRLKWGNLLLTSLTFGGIIFLIANNDIVIKIISATLSTISLGFSIFQISFNPEQEFTSHKLAAKELWYIREKYKSLIADIISKAVTEEQVRRRRDELLDELKIIYKFAPSTSNKSYKKAQNAIQNEGEQSFEIGEIDKVLPNSFKLENEDLSKN